MKHPNKFGISPDGAGSMSEMLTHIYPAAIWFTLVALALRAI